MANETIIGRITSLFRGNTKHVVNDKSTTLSGSTDEYSRRDVASKFKVEQDRRTIIKEANEMYHGDDRCEGIINNVAENATYGGFDIIVSDSAVGNVEKINEELQKLKRRCFKKLTPWVKKGLIEGDLFIQPVILGNQIIKTVRMPSLQMRRNTNDLDDFEDPLKAFAQVDPMSAAYFLDIKHATVETWFAEWQIIHARWNHLGGRYGGSIFRASRGSYKKIREGETDMAIRRKTRAGKKYLHSLEDATDTEIEAYKERNKDTLNNPFAAIADFFSNKKTTISSIEGDARLNDIKDVEHHIDTLFVGSPVPKSILGYGKDINRDVLEKQEAQYLRNLESLGDWIDEDIIMPIVDLQLLLMGILPESVTYSIKWPDRSVDLFKDVIDGATKLASLGVPKRVWLQIVKKVITDIDVESIAEEMERAETDNDSIAINQNLDKLTSSMASDNGKKQVNRSQIEKMMAGAKK